MQGPRPAPTSAAARELSHTRERALLSSFSATTRPQLHRQGRASACYAVTISSSSFMVWNVHALALPWTKSSSAALDV